MLPGKANFRHKPVLIQPVLAAQAAQAPDIGQSESEEKNIVVGHIRHLVAAVFRGHTAAVPVISGLGADELQLVGDGVITEAGRPAESALGELAIAERRAELVEAHGGRRIDG